MDAVVAIGFRDGTASSPRWAATGFLYGKKASATEPIYTVALVTNRHVFDGERSACLRFNPEGKDAAKELWVDLEDRDGAPLWASDPSVDLAVVAIRVDQLISSRIRVVLFRNDQDTLCLKDAEKAGVTEGDGVAVLGFPLGLVGSQRNYTIVRQGSIARIRDAFAGVSNEILVDTAVFPETAAGLWSHDPIARNRVVTTVKVGPSLSVLFLATCCTRRSRLTSDGGCSCGVSRELRSGERGAGRPYCEVV